MIPPPDGSDAHGPQQRTARLEAKHGGRRFVIEADPAVGFYLYVFDADRCTHDYVEDSLASAREFASEQFGVSNHVWREITSTL